MGRFWGTVYILRQLRLTRNVTKEIDRRLLPVFGEVCPEQHHAPAEALVDVGVTLRSYSVDADTSERRRKHIAQLHLVIVRLPVLQRYPASS